MTHEPNSPRTHNAKGQRVDEPVQCIVCLQAWPCEVERLTRENTRLRELNIKVMLELRECHEENELLRETARVLEAPDHD